MSYREQAARIAQVYGLDPEIFVRQIEQESAFDPMAVSPAGAGGIAQIMPGTAAAPGFGIAPISNQDRFNVPVALDFGAQYMRAMLDRYDGDYARALAAYNAGFGRVDDAGGVPNIPEAQNYVSRILGDGVSFVAGDRRLEGGMGADMLGTDQERPRGILESLGIQRRDPNAEGETGMPFFQRGSFKDFMGNLAMAFNELRDEPSQAIPAVVARNQERRQDDRQRNATTEWLMTQPGGENYVQLINSGATPSQAVNAYINAQRSDLQASQNANVQSVQQLPDGGAVYYMRDGQIIVRSVTGETLEGEAAQEYVREAQSYGADLQSQIYESRRQGALEAEIELGGAASGATVAGTQMVDRAFQAFDQLQNVNSSISTINEAIAAIDAGAQSGIIYNMLPSVTQASAALENAMNRMGLDVVSSVTFGALSEGELRLAMETAVPRNLSPNELREWLLERRDVQVRAAEALRNAANYFSVPGNTLQGWQSQQGGQQDPAAEDQSSGRIRYDAEGNRIP